MRGAADVLDAVGIGETEIAIEAVTDVIAVENKGVLAVRLQLLFEKIGDGGFAGTGQSSEPQAAGFLGFEFGAGRRRNGNRLPVDVGGAAQAEPDHTCRCSLIAKPVDQDEGAHLADRLIRVEGNRFVRLDVDDADLVEAERFCGQLLEAGEVFLVLDLGDAGGNRACADLQQIRATRQKWLIMHPDQMSGKLVGDFRPVVRRHQQIAARRIDFIGERQRHGIAGAGFVEIAVVGRD